MAQQDLLLALQILLDQDDLTEEAHTDALWTIAQLLGGFEHLGVCAQIRLLLRVLRLHVLDGEWDPTPALSYLEQLRLLAADGSLPGYVDAANVSPPASLLMTVQTQMVLQHDQAADATAEVAKHFSTAIPGTPQDARKAELERAAANPTAKHVFWMSHGRLGAADEVQRYVQTARRALGPIVVQHDSITDMTAFAKLHIGFAELQRTDDLITGGRLQGGFYDPTGRLDPAAFLGPTADAKLGRQIEQLHDLAGPSIMPQTLQTAAEATGQPVAAPPLPAQVAPSSSPARTKNNLGEALWDMESPVDGTEKAHVQRARKRRKWTPGEDEKLTEWVEARGLGTCDWAGFIRAYQDQLAPHRTSVDAKDRWRNILKKREQLRERMAALEKAQAEAEQAQAEAEQAEAEEEQQRTEAERRDALLSVAETELQSVSQGQQDDNVLAAVSESAAFPDVTPPPVPASE